MLSEIRDMIAAHPDMRGDVNDALAAAVEAAGHCALTCLSCADACLAEGSPASMVQCIRLNLDCADLCSATSAIALRRSGGNVPVIIAALRACTLACERCGDECESHAEHADHCRICAEACRACQTACEAALTDLAG